MSTSAHRKLSKAIQIQQWHSVITSENADYFCKAQIHNDDRCVSHFGALSSFCLLLSSTIFMDLICQKIAFKMCKESLVLMLGKKNLWKIAHYNDHHSQCPHTKYS